MDTKKLGNVGISAAGGFAVGAGLKMVNRPIANLVALGGMAVLAATSKNEKVKAGAIGGATIAAVAVVGDVAEKIPMMGKFAPQLSGAGDVYEDENGNLVDEDGYPIDEDAYVGLLPEDGAYPSDADMIL